MRIPVAAAALCAFHCAGLANADENDFIDANILSIFYHELGHAIIDLMQVPIFGQEEDAADVAAVLMIDWFFDEDTAQSIAYDSAFGFVADPTTLEDTVYWDVHGPDEQRFYNHVCIFYGANPDVRDDLAEELGLPQERADTCPEEYTLAAESWGAVFEELEGNAGSGALRLSTDTSFSAARISDILAPEISQMNNDFSFPETIDVRIEHCGEANAFYDPNDVSITFCIEFVDLLRGAFSAN
ncbi:MAG: DUF4344 domain-containing metallopeptidase [Roseobacter sp.]